MSSVSHVTRDMCHERAECCHTGCHYPDKDGLSPLMDILRAFTDTRLAGHPLNKDSDRGKEQTEADINESTLRNLPPTMF